MNSNKITLKDSLKANEAPENVISIIEAISVGAKQVTSLLTSPWERDLATHTGDINVQGEETITLDILADKIFIDLLNSTGCVRYIVSEEQESVVPASNSEGEFVVTIDPLDGSSNVGVNIPVGTIFAIFKAKEDCSDESAQFFRTGREIVAAGYVLYGVSTTLRAAWGAGVYQWSLDASDLEFYQTKASTDTPTTGKIYSVNEANSDKWNPQVQQYINFLKKGEAPLSKACTARYVGSLVSDFDRNFQKGGVFLYPADSKNEKGKLRLLYECMPLAYLVEQASGRATNFEQNILDLVPESIHERSPFLIGSRELVEIYPV